MMRLQFLGTASGAPTRQRNVSAVTLAPDEGRDWYLIDCGEGTQHQLLRAPLSPARLQAIFITHVHGDHLFGLPGLLSSASMSGRKQPLPIIAPAGVREFVETALAVSDSALSFALEWHDVSAADFAWRDERFSVHAVALSHRVPCWAYVFDERNVPLRLDTEQLEALNVPRGPLWGALLRGESITLDDGQRIEPETVRRSDHEPRRLVIAGDNDSPDLLRAACQNASVLVHESTFTRPVAERLGTTYQHSCADQIGAFAESIELPNLVLTHFSARYQVSPKGSGHDLEEVRSEAAAAYSGRLFLADDLECYELDAAGRLSLAR